MEAGTHISRLLHVKKLGKTTHILEVAPTRRSLNSGDAFILDIGTTIYCWSAESCSPNPDPSPNLHITPTLTESWIRSLIEGTARAAHRSRSSLPTSPLRVSSQIGMALPRPRVIAHCLEASIPIIHSILALQSASTWPALARPTQPSCGLLTLGADPALMLIQA